MLAASCAWLVSVAMGMGFEGKLQMMICFGDEITWAMERCAMESGCYKRKGCVVPTHSLFSHLLMRGASPDYFNISIEFNVSFGVKYPQGEERVMSPELWTLDTKLTPVLTDMGQGENIMKPLDCLGRESAEDG